MCHVRLPPRLAVSGRVDLQLVSCLARKFEPCHRGSLFSTTPRMRPSTSVVRREKEATCANGTRERHSRTALANGNQRTSRGVSPYHAALSCSLCVGLFFFILSIISALLLPLPSFQSYSDQPRCHIASTPPPSPPRCVSSSIIAIRVPQFLPSSTCVESRVHTLGDFRPANFCTRKKCLLGGSRTREIGLGSSEIKPLDYRSLNLTQIPSFFTHYESAVLQGSKSD